MKRLLSLPLAGLILSMLMAAKLASAQSHFTVEVTGHGRPMLFVHGLYCSGDVWKETIEHYKKNYECHVLTLAGFGDQAPNLNDNFFTICQR